MNKIRLNDLLCQLQSQLNLKKYECLPRRKARYLTDKAYDADEMWLWVYDELEAELYP